MLARAGLPDPLDNTAAPGSRRVRVAPDPLADAAAGAIEVDFRWDGLCVEVDGPGHERPRTRAEDRARDAELGAAGYATLRIADTDLDERPEAVRAALAAALARRRRGADVRSP